MTPEERAALLAAMYEADDEPEAVEGDALTELSDLDEPEPEPEPMTKAWVDRQAAMGKLRFVTDGRFVTLTVDGSKVRVPTADYVRKLEERVTSLDRDMLRMKALLKAMRTLMTRHDGDLNDVWRELDRKMNLRDI